MKANDAPEKIWMDSEWVSHFDCKDCITENSIEYVRKDAFIEKATTWLKEQEEIIGISFQEDFIARFKKYMED